MECAEQQKGMQSFQCVSPSAAWMGPIAPGSPNMTPPGTAGGTALWGFCVVMFPSWAVSHSLRTCPEVVSTTRSGIRVLSSHRSAPLLTCYCSAWSLRGVPRGSQLTPCLESKGGLLLQCNTTSHLLGWLLSEKQKLFTRMWRDWNTAALLVGM